MSRDPAEVSRATGALLATQQSAPEPPTTLMDGLFQRNPGYLAPLRGVALKAPDAPEDGPRGARWTGYGTWDYIKDLAAQETIAASLAIRMYEEGTPDDPSWSLPAQDSAEWKSLTEGLDPEKWGVLGRARSAEQARRISFRLREEVEREKRLMESGMLPFFVGNLLNPESLVLALGTGGWSWVQKGSRLARAAKLGGLTAAENIALEAALNLTQDNRDPTDIAIAGTAGLLLGGAIGAFTRGIPDEARIGLVDAAQRDIDTLTKMQAEELGILPPTPYTLRRMEIEADLKTLDAEVDAALDAEERLLRGVVDGPDGLAVRLRNDAGETMDRLQRTRDHQAEVARAQAGLSERIRAAEAPRAAPAESIDALKATRRELDSRSEKLYELASILQSDVDRVNRVRAAEVSLEQLLAGRKAARSRRARLGLLPPARRAQMTRRVDELERGLAETLRAELNAPAAAPRPPTGTFGPDSAGAARASQGDVEVSRFGEPDVETAPTRIYRFLPRFDYASILRSPKLPTNLRERFGRYLGDPVPARGEVSVIGATEKATQLRERFLTLFHRTYEPAFEEWAGSYASTLTRSSRSEFGRLVVRELKGVDTGIPQAQKAATTLRRIFAEIGQEAKDAGVRGFEEFTPDANYFPRVPDRVKIEKNIDQFSAKAIEAVLQKGIAKGYADAGLEIDPKIVARIASGYLKTLRDLARGLDRETMTGFKLADVEQIAGLMRLDGVDDETIASVVGRLRSKLVDGGADGGTPRYSKSRQLMDDTEEFELRDMDDKVHRMSLRDLLFHDDAEQVFQTYNHTMSGWAALARYAGVRSKADHDKMVEAALKELPRDIAERTAEALDDAYNTIIGQPLFDTNRWQTTRRIGRALRDYQFARVMNMVGFAQIPDAASYLVPQYARHLRHHFPDMLDFFQRAKDGTLKSRLATEMEEWTSMGTDTLHNRLYSAYDDEPDAPLSRVEHGIRVAGRFTERNPFGVGPATALNQRLAEIAITQRFADNVLGRANDIPLDRWKKLGLSEDDLKMIAEEMKKHVEYDKQKLRVLDLAKWNPEAREKFVMAVHREGRRLVQEEDFGETHPLMHSALGKMLLQFRRFGLVSYTKQFYRGIADRDIETITRIGLQINLGGLSYAAQMYLYSLTLPPEEQQEWREKYLNLRMVFFAGIARAGFFSLTPALFETMWQMALGTEGVFSATRTTGLAGSLLAGVPVIDFASNVARTLGSFTESIIREDRQYDQQDFAALRKVLLLQNMIGIRQMLDLIQNTLPERDEDDDQDRVDLIFGLGYDQMR